MILIVFAAFASAWGIRAWLVRQADDTGRFSTHEEAAECQAWLRTVTRKHAREAEEEARRGGPDLRRWAEEAANLPRRAAIKARLR